MHPTPEETLRAYVKAFESLDPDAVAPFYRLPCTFIGPQGAVVVSDDVAARSLVSLLVEHARSQGYHRTETVGLEVRRLASNLATLAGVFVRFNSSDEEVSRFGFAYTMLGDDSGWKIAVAIAHDAPATPR